jgi:glycosyltransferase involved in cell wall biosynthesis
MNPARDKNITYTPSRVTATMMTYIPNLEGYFTHRLEVLKLSLASLIESLDGNLDLMVMNNGSCSEVQDFLEDQLHAGRIQYLIHSRRNLGVIGGLKVLFNAALGEVIAYSDDDVLYYPGWLDAHLNILDTYPNAGMVSGAPVGYSSEHATKAVDKFISEPSSKLEVLEKPRVPAWEQSWAESTGRSVKDHLEEIKASPNQHFIYQGVEAVRSAKHFQFVTPKKVICDAFSADWSGSLMDGLVALDESVDELGYLRLTTPVRYAQHIGNAISDEIQDVVEELGIRTSINISDVEQAEHWLLKIPGSGRILWPIYRWLFKVLHNVR